MIETYLLLIAGAFYLLGAASLFLRARLAKWIWACGSLLFAILLAAIALLSQLSFYSNPVEVKITNYSSKSGQLYFLDSGGKTERIRYEKAINANEESTITVEGEGGGYDSVLFLSEDTIYQLPGQKPAYWVLDIWEKELKPAETSYRQLLQSWQNRQQMYSIAIGLMLFWFLLHLFYLRWQGKRSEKRADGSRQNLTVREV